MKNIIISGLRTTPDAHLQHTPGENDTLEENVLALFNKHLGVPITNKDISVCHTLKRRSNESINDNNRSEKSSSVSSVDEVKQRLCVMSVDSRA